MQQHHQKAVDRHKGAEKKAEIERSKCNRAERAEAPLLTRHTTKTKPKPKPAQPQPQPQPRHQPEQANSGQ